MVKVLLIKLPSGNWSILREDGKLAPKHEFHHGIPLLEVKQWCEAKKLTVHGVICPDWDEHRVAV